MYYKENSSLTRKTDLSNLWKNLANKSRVGKEIHFLTCLYRSSGQNDENKKFFSDLSFCLNNIDRFQPSCSILEGDFN